MNDMAKVVWTGDDQAVHLPEGYRFDTTEVRVTREGNRIVLEAAYDAIDAETGLPVAMLHRLIEEGLNSKDEPWDSEDIKRRGRERLVAGRSAR